MQLQRNFCGMDGNTTACIALGTRKNLSYADEGLKSIYFKQFYA